MRSTQEIWDYAEAQYGIAGLWVGRCPDGSYEIRQYGWFVENILDIV